MTTELKHWGVEPEEEFVQMDYPRNDSTPWKENMGFIITDREKKASFMIHVSLERHKKRARFSTTHKIGDETYYHQEFIDIDDNFTEFDSGRVRFEFVKPLEEIRVTDVCDEYQLEAVIKGRFGCYDYAHHRKDKTPTGKDKSMNVRHFEQALTGQIAFTKGGETRTFEGLGFRDHTWGYRNDAELDGWRYCWAHFPDRLIQAGEIRQKERNMVVGYIQTAETVVRIKSMETVEIKTNEAGDPIGATYRLTDKEGNVHTLTSSMFNTTNLPWPDRESCKRSDGGYMEIFENYSDFTLAETGETGVGSDEHYCIASKPMPEAP